MELKMKNCETGRSRSLHRGGGRLLVFKHRRWFDSLRALGCNMIVKPATATLKIK